MRKKKLKNFWRINEHLKNNKYWLLRQESNLQKLKTLKLNFTNQNKYLNKVKIIQRNLKNFSKNQLIKIHLKMKILIKEIKRIFQSLVVRLDKLNLIQLISLLTLYKMKLQKVGMANKQN